MKNVMLIGFLAMSPFAFAKKITIGGLTWGKKLERQYKNECLNGQCDTEALMACQQMGGRLPTEAEYKNLISYYDNKEGALTLKGMAEMAKVFTDLSLETEHGWGNSTTYWTSTDETSAWLNYKPGAATFCMDRGGSFGGGGGTCLAERRSELNVRCVYDGNEETYFENFAIYQDDLERCAKGSHYPDLKILRGNDGKVLKLNQDDAIKACADRGMRLPTAWKYADIAKALGGEGRSEISAIPGRDTPPRHKLIETVEYNKWNPDGIGLDFYYRTDRGFCASGDLGKENFWTASKSSKTKKRGAYFSGKRYGQIGTEQSSYDKLAVACLPPGMD